jgi:hypothetical protein
MTETMLTIYLPSLIHRIGRDKVKEIKGICSESNCSLRRVRRSRNWQLSGERDAIAYLIQSLKDIDYLGLLYLITKVESQLVLFDSQFESPEQKLIRLINENPVITLSELMDQTGCSMSEARAARFSVDIF